MRSIRFHTAGSLREALELKAERGVERRFLAGGTDLVVALREESRSLPSVDLIDITRIAELEGIAIDPAGEGSGNGTIRLGPLTTFAEIERSELLSLHALLLVEAAGDVGSPQIRNRGTVGGNICNASSCADSVPPLVALEAELTLSSLRGARRIALEEAITAPHETVLGGDEILTEIRFPSPPASAGSSFVKLGRRGALSVSRMSIAAIVVSDSEGRLESVRLAAGSVTPTVRRFRAVESLLERSPVGEAKLAEAGAAVAAEMIEVTGRRWSTAYKEPVVASLVQRALARAIERSRR